MRYTITAESEGEKNLKIGPYLRKLWARIKVGVFFSEHSVYRQTLNLICLVDVFIINCKYLYTSVSTPDAYFSQMFTYMSLTNVI